MSTLAQFFPVVSGSAVTNPNLLLKAAPPPTSLVTSAGNDSTGAGFWSFIGTNNIATVVDTDYAAATWKTILSASGAGDVASIIGPTIASNGATVDFEITVDGAAAQVVTWTAPSATAARPVVGGVYFQGGANSFTQALTGNAFTADASRRWATSSLQILPPQALRQFNWTRLRFTSSILVRIRSSVVVTTTTLNERQSGVTYLLD